MKNMTKIVVAISLMLAASLLVAPAAADRAWAAGQFQISDGDTIFVWEENLDLSTNLGPVTRLRKFVDDDPAKALVHEIPVADAGSFDVVYADVQRHYGVYYTDFWDEIVIREPSLTTDVKLSGTVSSVDGTTIGDNEEIYFRVNAPYVGAFYANRQFGEYAKITVEFTTPGGAKRTTFGGVDLRGVDLTSTQLDTVDIPLRDERAGTYTAVVKWNAPGGFADYAASSGSVSFTTETRLLEITSNVDSVVRNNNFVVTISGESAYDYRLFVKNPEAVAAENPRITAGQPGVTLVSETEANVRTRADGTRPIEFYTTSDTKDKTFTIRVEDWADPDEYDEVKVRVEAGAITVEASGDRTYYIGEEVTFSGTNTDSDTVYFFITGPNLPREGGQLLSPMDPVDQLIPGTFRPTPVRTDDTYERRWSTSGIGLDAGSYTIYALTDPFNRNNLADANDYDSVSIVLRKPFVTATPSATTVAKGDDIYIRGTAEGEPSDGVAVWVFGRNYFFYDTVDVEDDGTFEFDGLDTAWTSDRSAGQYFVVVQHPMENDIFDVFPTYPAPGTTIVVDRFFVDEFVVEGPGRLQGAQAAQALIDLLNKPQIDDTYVRASFLVEEPWIRIDRIGDRYVGDTFTITGTTNLAVDNDLIVEVISSRFEPAPKEAPAEFAGASGTVRVVDGNADYNTWSFEVDATPFAPDEYIVSVESIEAEITSTTTFNVLDAVPVTPTPEPTPTPVPTPTPTPTPPPEPTPEPAPGFGALVAIAGLVAVAFLVIRRN